MGDGQPAPSWELIKALTDETGVARMGRDALMREGRFRSLHLSTGFTVVKRRISFSIAMTFFSCLGRADLNPSNLRNLGRFIAKQTRKCPQFHLLEPCANLPMLIQGVLPRYNIQRQPCHKTPYLQTRNNPITNQALRPPSSPTIRPQAQAPPVNASIAPHLSCVNSTRDSPYYHN